MNTQKTNWKFILIVLVLAFIVGGGILVYQKFANKEIETQILEIPLQEYVTKSEAEKRNKDLIFEIPEESLEEVSLIDLKEGKNRIGDIIIEKIGLMTNADNIIFKIDDDIKVESPKYKGEGSPSSWEAFERGYTIYYKNKQIYKDTSTALNVFIFSYKNKKYIAIQTASAGTGGVFYYLSLFDFKDRENIKFLDTISVNGSLKDIIKEINYLNQ